MLCSKPRVGIQDCHTNRHTKELLLSGTQGFMGFDNGNLRGWVPLACLWTGGVESSYCPILSESRVKQDSRDSPERRSKGFLISSKPMFPFLLFTRISRPHMCICSCVDLSLEMSFGSNANSLRCLERDVTCYKAMPKLFPLFFLNPGTRVRDIFTLKKWQRLKKIQTWGCII